MFEELKEYILKFVPFTDDEFNAVIPKVETVSLKKNEYFVREGEIANYIAFTQRGYLRVYYLHNGVEITRDISPLHSFVTALPSFIKRKPSFEIIRAITDCELIIIKKSNLDYLYDNFPKWQKLGYMIMEDMFVQTQNRIYSFIVDTAEVRLQNMLSEFPDIFRYVPLQYIASYLGITSQSLSRLRKSESL